VAAIRVIRITESTVEVLQADGTTRTYNSHAEFMAAPEAERTIGGQRINLVDNEMEIAGEAIHIGPNIYYEGVPEPGISRLVQDPTVIDEVVVTELPDGTAHFDLHITHTDVDGSVYRARVRTDAGGTVIESEILDGTRLAKISRLKSVISGLRNSRVLRAASTGAEYAAVFGHGLILAIAINGIYYGDWKWVAPELATSVATGIMVKVGATALRANLVGTIIGSIFELGIYSWEERSANEIKDEFGIDQTSTWDDVKGGLKRMADSYWELLKKFSSPEHGYGQALEDKITGDMDTYLVKNYETMGITKDQRNQLKEQLMANGQYSQKYHEQMILPIEGTLFNSGPQYDQYNTGKPEDLAKELNKRMCVLLEDWQEDTELHKVGVYLDEKSFRNDVMDAEFRWWKTQLVGAQNELQKSKKLKTTPDPKTNGIGIDRIEESTSGDTIIVDDYWTGKGSVPFYIDADKAIGFIDGVQKSLEGMNCEDIAKDLQYRVFVKNNFEEKVECDKGTNTATLKWEIKSGTDCDKDAGYADITSSVCGETAPLIVPVGSDVEAFCTSKDKDHLIKDLYPEKNGPYCVRVTWCGQPEVFKYGGKDDEKLKTMSVPGGGDSTGAPTGNSRASSDKTPKKCYDLYGDQIKTPLKVSVNPTNIYGLSDDYILQKIRNAMNTWQKGTAFKLFEDAEIDKSIKYNGPIMLATNRIVISFEDENTAPLVDLDEVGEALRNPVSGEIIGCNIILNKKYKFGEPDTSTNTMDLQGIITHELGHCTGLADIYDTNGECSDNIMNEANEKTGFQKAYTTALRDLKQGDMEGLKAIYG